MHVNATRYARQPQICGCILAWDRYAQGISECLRSTRILQNKRVVCVKFLFRGGGADAGIPRGLPLFRTAFGQREHALFEAGWRGWGRWPLTKIRRNSKLFAHPIDISREKRTRLCIERGIDETNIYIYVYMYAQHRVINNSWEP